MGSDRVPENGSSIAIRRQDSGDFSITSHRVNDTALRKIGSPVLIKTVTIINEYVFSGIVSPLDLSRLLNSKMRLQVEAEESFLIYSQVRAYDHNSCTPCAPP